MFRFGKYSSAPHGICNGASRERLLVMIRWRLARVTEERPMDLSKLSQNEKLAAVGAAMAVVGGLVAASTYPAYGLAWIGILAGVAMLVIVLQPQLAPKTSLPGSRGSLMIVVGGIGGAIMVLGLLTTLEFTFFRFGIADLLFLVAVAGAVLMAYAAWREFQAEGGKLRIGGGTTAGASAADSPAPTEQPTPPPAQDEPPAREDRGTDESR